MDTSYKKVETGCCPQFNPEPWDGKEHTWQDKLFIKDHVVSFMHIPLNFGMVMVKNMKKIEKAGAISPDWMTLSDEKSPWGADVYVSVDKDVPDAETVKISGTFLTKVFEGPFKDIRGWVKEMEEFVASRGKEMKKMYAYYTTCPKCAKHRGKNYVVLVAEV